MDREQLENRTLAFAVSVVRLVGSMTACHEKTIIGNQLLRAATSVGANYREANRAESKRDFGHKLAITEKEAAEATYWLELLRDAALVPPGSLDGLLSEARQLVRIFNAARRTIRTQTLRDPKI
jgi:four helix bundle protein